MAPALQDSLFTPKFKSLQSVLCSLKKWQFWREILKKLLMPYISQNSNGKIRELSLEQRVAVKYLRESCLSYREIGRPIGCNHSTALKIYKKFVSTGSVSKQDGPGCPSKFDERGKRTICRVARRLRFSTLKTIVSDVRRYHHYQSASAPLVRKILHKYKLQSFKRKRKSCISVKNRAYRLHKSLNCKAAGSS